MFDPYHKWLGIAPDQRPPSYYRLLGIAEGEKDREVIEAAAVRQSAYVRNFQAGSYAEHATKLLNEISEARIVLVDPAKRAEYDAKLAASRPKPKPVPKPAAPVVMRAVAVEPPPPPRTDLPRPRSRRKKSDPTPLVLLSILVVCAAALGGAAWFIFGRGDGTTQVAENDGNKNSATVDDTKNNTAVDANNPPNNGGANGNEDQGNAPPFVIPGNQNPPIPNNMPPDFGKRPPFGGPPPGFGKRPPGFGGPPPGFGMGGPKFGPGNGPNGNQKPNPPIDMSVLRVGMDVLVLRGNEWKPAQIRKLEPDRAFVNFYGFSEDFNEWADASRIRHVDDMLVGGNNKKGNDAPGRGKPASSISEALSDLASSNVFTRRDGARFLSTAEVDAKHKDEVAKALNAYVSSNNHIEDEAYIALVRWANDESINVLAAKLEVRPFVEKPAIRAAGETQHEQLVLPLCRLLEDFFAWKHASAALKSMGPVAERQVMKLLQHRDPKMRMEACAILSAIGTDRSLAVLRRAATDKNVKLAAQQAIESINIRLSSKSEDDEKGKGKSK